MVGAWKRLGRHGLPGTCHLAGCGEGQGEVTSTKAVAYHYESTFRYTPQNEHVPVGCHAASSTREVATAIVSDTFGKPYGFGPAFGAWTHVIQKIPLMGTSDASLSNAAWGNMDR